MLHCTAAGVEAEHISITGLPLSALCLWRCCVGPRGASYALRTRQRQPQRTVVAHGCCVAERCVLAAALVSGGGAGETALAPSGRNEQGLNNNPRGLGRDGEGRYMSRPSMMVN